MYCHIRSSASAASSTAIRSTMVLRQSSRSSTRSRRLRESMTARDRRIVAMRCRTSLASSAVTCAPASSSRSNRRAAGLPLQISISSSARRSAPRASRFLVLRVFFDVISQPVGIAVWMGRTLIRRSRSRNSWDRGRLARRQSGQSEARCGAQPQSLGRPETRDKR